MAKKKIAEIPEEVQAEAVANAAEMAEEVKAETAAPSTEVAKEAQTEEVKNKEAETVTETTVKVDELPDHAKTAFKLYPDADALYVDTKGGVFPADTKPYLVGSAILYKNPYKS